MGSIAAASSNPLFPTKKEFEWEDIAPLPLTSKETTPANLVNWEREIAADTFKELPAAPFLNSSCENQKSRDWEIVSLPSVNPDCPYLATLTKLDSFFSSSILDDLFSSSSKYAPVKKRAKARSTSQPYEKTNQKNPPSKHRKIAPFFYEDSLLGPPTCGKCLAPVKIKKPTLFTGQIKRQIIETLLKGNYFYFYLEDATPNLFEKRKGPFEVLSLSFFEDHIFVNFQHYKGASPSLDQCLPIKSTLLTQKKFDYLFLEATSQPLGSYFLLTNIAQSPIKSSVSGELVSIEKSPSSPTHQKWMPKKTGIQIRFFPRNFGPLGFLGLSSERLLALLNQDPPLFRIQKIPTQKPEALPFISLFKL